MEPLGRLITLTHPSGAYVVLSALGASWLSAFMPDRNGVLEDVLIGYADVGDYVSDSNYIGRTVGPFANRIKQGAVITNHSGLSGWSYCLFDVACVSQQSVLFTLDYTDPLAQFPPMQVAVEYRLGDDLSLTISHRVIPTDTTFLSVTNHAYFNLSGHGHALQHQLQIDADRFLDTDNSFLPTGNILPVADSPFDFRQPTIIGQRLSDQHPALLTARGYNTCYLLNHHLPYDACLTDLVTGRVLIVKTDLPALLFYSGGFLSSSALSKQGVPLQASEGVALETQFCPDSPNHPDFPNCMFDSQHIYSHTTSYQFSIL